MKSNANKLLVTSAIAIALLVSGAVFSASTQPAIAEAGYFWDENVESVDRSPWIFEGTNVFGELARVPPSDWVRTLDKAAYTPISFIPTAMIQIPLWKKLWEH